jgi:ribosomal protein L16/L10AE
MKTFIIHYSVKHVEYKTKVIATTLRVARHKLSIAHKCVIKAVKIIDCTEV